MSACYPSLTLGVKLRDIKAYPWWKQYIHMASMNYFLNKNESRTIRVTWYLYKQWEFLLLFKHSLNIAIIQLHSKERKRIISSIQNHDHSVEGDLENANSAQTDLYFVLLMLYKTSTCKIFWLCAVGFFHNFYSLKTIFFLFINLQVL
jgi:hypothetical protein